MTEKSHRWIGAVAIACLGMATGWGQPPQYATTIMVLGSVLILLVLTLD